MVSTWQRLTDLELIIRKEKMQILWAVEKCLGQLLTGTNSFLPRCVHAAVVCDETSNVKFNVCLKAHISTKSDFITIEKVDVIHI